MGRSATEWTGPTAQPGAGADDDALACVIVNPSKPAVTADFRRRLARALRSAGYRGPVWLDTTVAEPGATQARLAVASGARLVIAVGGDGTVRAVAAGLAGTDVELGVVPLGTANLAARNLGLPVGDLDALIDIAVFFSARPTDLAWVRTTPCPNPETGPP
ncbi:diacylglycerol/lipid kinase family protein, partial [Actinomyces dentalis]|uniref:diacylglycerol/lipid kinase family protein n=1 Tax=Actinomyces dentalis TaxID=272548 RepID=UPI002352F677